MLGRHQRRFLAVDHAKEAGNRLAPLARRPHIGQQLREHQQRRRRRFLGLEPDFRRLDIDQPLEYALEAKRLDVRVLDVFFGAGSGKQLCQTHEMRFPVCAAVILLGA